MPGWRNGYTHLVQSETPSGMRVRASLLARKHLVVTPRVPNPLEGYADTSRFESCRPGHGGSSSMAEHRDVAPEAGRSVLLFHPI